MLGLGTLPVLPTSDRDALKTVGGRLGSGGCRDCDPFSAIEGEFLHILGPRVAGTVSLMRRRQG